VNWTEVRISFTLAASFWTKDSLVLKSALEQAGMWWEIKKFLPIRPILLNSHVFENKTKML
jgi:hypothetical protein